MRPGLTALLVIGLTVVGCGSGPTAAAPSTAAPAAAVPSSAASPPSASASPAETTVGIGLEAFGPDGTLYADDCGMGVVVALTSPTSARIVAGSLGPPPAPGPTDGTGLPTFGDGGPATAASFVCPRGLAFDADGRLLIADHGHNRIRRVEADGTITTVVGYKSPPYVNAGEWAGDGGPARDASLDAPVGITVAQDGRLFIADRENDRVRVVSPDGIIDTLAGSGKGDYDGDGGPADQASLDYPLSTVMDVDGNVYIADDNHNRVRVVHPDGTIGTVIGDGTFASGGDGGPAAKAQVNDPQGVALDAHGNLYVSEYGGNRIRRIDPKGIVTTIAGTGEASTDGPDGPALEVPVTQPGALVIGPDGALYSDDQQNGWIIRIDLKTGALTHIAGGPDGVSLEPAAGS